MRLGIIITLATLILSGCLDTAQDDQDIEEVPEDPLAGLEDPFVIGGDHDHSDRSAHDFLAPTMEVLGRTTFNELGVPTPTFGEADLLGDDHIVVAALLNGFYIVDISDRGAPRAVGHFAMPGFIADVKASKSGDFVFLGVQLAGFTGIQAYNVAVKQAPVPAGAWPMAGGCHMLAVHNDHLYCAPNDATIRIFKVTETPGAVALVPVGVYDPTGDAPAPVAANPFGSDGTTHDMTVQDDPLTGEPVMFVSFWDDGVHAVDVSDPAKPIQLGVWDGEGVEDDIYEGALHTSMATAIDGRRIIATLPEYATTPAVFFLDATDFEDIQLLGVWAPRPGDHYDGESSRFSMHNFQFVEGKVYVGMYHGGAWIVDVSTPERLAEPLPVGYVVMSADRPHLALGAALGGGPNVWDVLVKDGHIYLSDMASGLWAVHYEGDPLGDPAWTGFA